MSVAEIRRELVEQGVLRQGHFRLSSGLHSEYYMQCAALFEQPTQAGKMVAKFLDQLPSGIDTVIAPAIGGITFGYELARQLEVRSLFAEREGSFMTLRRGFSLSKGERVLVAEDVVTTGGSAREVLELAQAAGCEIVGVAAIVDRSGGKVDFGAPFFSLISVTIEAFDPGACPLCAQGIPIEKPGSRRR